MRIMYLLFSFTIGGTERLVVDICNEMVKKNDVHLYIVNDYYSDLLLKELDSSIHVHLEKRAVGGKKIDAIVNVTNYIRKNMIEVVHCNSFSAPQLLILKGILFHNVTVVHTIHSLGNFAGMDWLKKKMYSNVVDSFIAISDTVKDDIVKAGFSGCKIRVFYNSIDVQKYIDAARYRNIKPCFEIEKKERPIRIGSLGRIDLERKGQDILLEALLKIDKTYNIECYIGGEPDKTHKTDMDLLNDLAKRVMIRGTKVNFMGLVTDAPAFFNELDIFVMPSRSEGFGISLVEAMAMGIPCIACDQNGPAEIIGDNERGLLFRTGDASNLAQRIIEMIDGEYKLHLNHIEYVKENFSIQLLCENLEKVYRNKK